MNLYAPNRFIPTEYKYFFGTNLFLLNKTIQLNKIIPHGEGKGVEKGGASLVVLFTSKLEFMLCGE